MSTGQTILSIGAFMFLTTILLNFYRVAAETGDTIASGQDGILATTIAASYAEIAQGLAFDEVTDTTNAALASPSVLTSSSALGAEAGEDSIGLFNDFDDFNGKFYDKPATGTNRTYRTQFTVSYVNPDNINQKSSVRTFVKRMDLKTWRITPAPSSPTEIDTIRTFLVLGYFHFD
jgi:hypothetical protein